MILWRVACFGAVLWLIHDQHQSRTRRQRIEDAAPLKWLQQWFPQMEKVGEGNASETFRTVLGGNGQELGYYILSAPRSDRVRGYSGPNDLLLAFDPGHRLLGMRLLRSGDTPDHVAAVTNNPAFLGQFKKQHRKDLVSSRWMENVDAVSGATLTSLAIAEGISVRLGGSAPSLRFPQKLSLKEIQEHWPGATDLKAPSQPANWHTVYGADEILGYAARTSPAADGIIGYQGPSDMLLVFDLNGSARALSIRKSYENKEYYGYLQEDEYYLNSFRGWTLERLAAIDMNSTEVEGVSGATMTSQAVAAAAKKRAQWLLDYQAHPPSPPPPAWKSRDTGLAIVLAGGLLFAFTSLRGNRTARLAFRVALVIYLGFFLGDMLSLSLLGGWAQNGVEWTAAPGLLMLALAAVLVPLGTGRQLYCHQICPHGALQEMLRRRLPWQWTVPVPLARWLRKVPLILLAIALLGAMGLMHVNLSTLEPFDAYLIGIAGWGSIAIAILGLVASLFVSMAYCRYGCPTGALLSFLRRNSSANQWSAGDSAATALLLVAAFLHWM